MIRPTSFAAAAMAAFLLTSPIAYAGDMKPTGGTAEMNMAAHTLGDLTLKAPFARATLPNQPVAGAFLTITNNGTEDDVLIAVSSPISQRGEVHEMKMDGDTMKMREMADGLVIPAGETVELKPGGYHLMFMQLNEPLIEGETVEMTLEFQNAGSITVPVAIMGKGAKTMNHGGQGS
jgi:copper(I)-binding protein